MDTQTKSAGAGALTPVDPRLTASKERLMSQRTSTTFPDHHATCRLFLELAADDLAKAKRARDHYVRLSHRYGMSNVDIGRSLGVSEARVRAILRDGGDA